MSLLGGVILREPGRPAGTPLLEAMAARVPGAGTPFPLTSANVGFVVGASGKAPRRLQTAIAAADLDLVNLNELRALTGLTVGCEVLGRLYEL